MIEITDDGIIKNIVSKRSGYSYPSSMTESNFGNLEKDRAFYEQENRSLEN